MSDTYSTKTNLSSKAREAARDAKAKAAEMTEELTKGAKDNAAQLGNTAREFANTAKEKVGEAMDQRKSIGADYIGSIAQATQQAAMAFDNDLPQAASYIRQASDQIRGVADNLRNKDVRQIVGDVQEFARQQPTLFFGGAVVLGFAALRFLKSTPPKQSTAFDARREE
jgi:hypothetical protein